MNRDSRDIPEIRISHLAGADARRVLGSNPVILLPMGSHEDQGPHAPMGDFLLAQRIAELAARRAHHEGTPTFVAPVLPFGGEDYFRSAIGGVVLRQSTMTDLLKDIAYSLIDNGLTRIIVLNGHGGNVNPATTMCREVHHQRRIVIPQIYLWEAAYAILPEIVGSEAAQKRAGHGADPLGSVLMYLMPELHRPEHLPSAKPLKADPSWGLPFSMLGRASVAGIPVALPNDYADVFNDGVAAGDPNLCDAETGKALVDRLTRAISDLAALMFSKK